MHEDDYLIVDAAFEMNEEEICDKKRCGKRLRPVKASIIELTNEG